MFTNLLKTAIRNLSRNKVFSIINIFGLALGIATCLLIMLFVQNELSYDRYHEKADRIFRVVFRGMMQGGELKEANVMPPVAQTLLNDYPEVEAATRIRTYGMPRVTFREKLFKEDAFAFVDASFFEVFTLPFVKGDQKTALLRPNSVVISSSVAKKYFGDEEPLGKVLTFKDNNNAALTITGVIDDVPANSHFHFGFFASMSTLPEAREPDWFSSNFFTYLVLRKGSDYKSLEARLPQVVEKYMGPEFQQKMGLTLAQFQEKGNSIGFALQPLTDIHLHSDMTGDMEPYGDIRYVYIFTAVAVFMLLIACINFMNLSTAGASKRAREVGVRKVMGSGKAQLVRQFLLESVLLTAVAMIIAIGIVYQALPFFNALAGQTLRFQISNNPAMIAGLVLFTLVTGLFAGCYPAFFLSSYNPVSVLKGRFNTGKKSMSLRSGLVVFQFFISISLIVGTTVVYRQLSYIQHKKLGYDKEQVVIIEEAHWLGDNVNVFRRQLLQDPRVLSVTASGFLPAGHSNNNNFFVYPDDRSSQLVKTLKYEIDQNYIPTLGMEMAAGRNFSESFGSDSSAAIINETAARAFGWGADASEHTITRNENDGSKKTYRVIGVVKDFHFRSLHELITPLVMVLGSDNGTMIAKVKTTDLSGLLNTMQEKWKDLKAEAPFSFSFLDERFYNTYKAEQNIGRILGIFSGLTILVACLGLFGLAMFTAEQRTREIGIRKVLGASATGIVSLLSKDFLKLVLLAILIASPVAWYITNRWLQDFAYRISVEAWMFVLAAVLAIAITIITVSFHALRVALTNPVKTLRSE